MNTKLNHLKNFNMQKNSIGIKRLLHNSFLVICLLTTNVLLHSQSIETFLNANPKIANEVVWCTQAYPLIEVAYADWDPAMKSELQDLYDGIAIGNYPDFAQPFDNLYDEPGGYSTYISMENGKTAYMAYLATSLYFEMNNTFSWKIADYNPEQISRIVNYKSFLDPKFNAASNYQQSFRLSNSMFAPPAFLMPGFFEKYNIIEPTSDYETFSNILEYSKGLRHFTGSYSFDNFEDHWQYRGVPPAQRIIEGTTRSSDNIFGSFTAGCHGTNSFYMTICRLINIPVVYARNAGHAVPFVPTIDSMFITHGDDPYNKINKSMDLHNKNLLVNKFHLQSIGFGGGEYVGSRVWALDINEFSYYTKSRFCRESIPDYTNPELSIIVNTYGEAFLDSIRYLDRLFYTLKEEGYSNTCTGPTDYVEYPINWTSTSNVNTTDKRLIKTNRQQPFAARSNTLIRNGHWVEAVVYNTQPDTWLGLDPSTADQDLNQIEYAIGMSDNRVEVYNFGNLVFETVNPHNFSIAYLKISVDNNQVKYAINGHTLYQQSLSNPNLEYTVFAGGSDELSEINTIVSNSQELASGDTGGCIAGQACNDGDACTVGDVYDADCNCAGVLVDTDGDGVCDADDQCPGFNDALIGTACDDGDDCTIGETYNANCGCTGGTFQDADNDGVCDADDICPDGDDTVDTDNDGTPDACDDCSTVGQSCDDGDNCTTGETYDANCNCTGGTFQDADNDGVCDADDICPDGDDTVDTDNDGTPDACDDCSTVGQSCDDGDNCTTGETYDVNCNCTGGTFQDADNDGVCDADDICPDGDDTVDTDNDGTPDACDDCSTVGQSCNDNDSCTTNDVYDADCNCAGELMDADNDGVCDAEDICPGHNDTIDSDGDGIPDGCEECEICINAISSFPHTEGFENGASNICQSISDDFDWTLNSGETNSNKTGPSAAYEGSNYVFCEASFPNNPNKIATFTGSCFDLSRTSTASIDFWTHMYGKNIGNLVLKVSIDEGQTWTPVWSMSGNQGNSWLNILVDLSYFTGGTMTYQFTATTLNGYAGDIALDNITIATTSTCVVGSSCDDNDECTVGETLDLNCECNGGISTDNDEDGYCAELDPNDNDPCVPEADPLDCDPDTSDCIILDFTDFESGLGVWNDGGADARLQSRTAISGASSIRLSDNSGIESSIYTDPLALSGYESVIVSFDFITKGMKNGEDFMLEVSLDGGSNFTIVKSWVTGTDFNNKQTNQGAIELNGYVLNNQVVLRIRCDASNDSDLVYLDDIKIEACRTTTQIPFDINARSLRNSTDELILALYPNPVMDVLNIEIPEAKELTGTITIYSISGVKVYETETNLESVNSIRTNHLESNQIYMCRITTESGQVLTKKFLKI